MYCNFDVVFCDWAIWKNRGILKFSSEYGPSIKKKYTNKQAHMKGSLLQLEHHSPLPIEKERKWHLLFGI